MASASPQSKQLLSCALCCKVYNDEDRKPKILPCSHTICSVCLQAMLEKTGQQVECLSCCTHTQVGEEGVEGLQTNVYVAALRAALDESSTHGGEEGCSKHSREALSFYCATCDQQICRDCTVLDHSQLKGHAVQDISDADARVLELLAEVDISSRQQMDALIKDINSEICKMELDKDRKIQEFVNKTTQKHDGQIKQLNAKKEEVANKIDTVPHITKCGHRVTKVVFNFKLNKAVACHHTSATFILYNDAMIPITSCDAAMLITYHEDDKVMVKATPSADGSFVVNFTPKSKGRHEAHAIVEGRVFEGPATEFMVEANNQAKKFAGKDPDAYDLHQPTAVVIDKDGNYYLASAGTLRILMFDSDGMFVKQHKVDQTTETTFVFSIALDEVDRRVLYLPSDVFGQSAGTVRCYNPQDDTDDLLFHHPMEAYDLTVNSQRHVIVSHTGPKRCLMVFDMNGTLLTKIGNSSIFQNPFYVTIDAADNIYASDRGNSYVLKFSKIGDLLLTIGKAGTKNGEFYRPKGVAVNGQHIIVVDSDNSRIQLYHMDGVHAGIIDIEKDPASSRASGPTDVAITNTGEIAVTDFTDHCVKLYKVDMK